MLGMLLMMLITPICWFIGWHYTEKWQERRDNDKGEK